MHNEVTHVSTIKWGYAVNQWRNLEVDLVREQFPGGGAEDRRGLGVAAPGPQYVLTIDGPGNSLIVGPASAAACDEFAVVDCHWLAVERLAEPLAVEVRLRHAARRLAATVFPGRVDSCATVRLTAPHVGVTPGQAAVFYLGEMMLGGGTIRLSADPIVVK